MLKKVFWLACFFGGFSHFAQAKDQQTTTSLNKIAFNESLTERMSKISGLTWKELPSSDVPLKNYRVFEMQFMQPMDHDNKEGPWFQQKLILWHKNEIRPMVLQTSGYAIFSVALSSLASEFNANQIQVEHRYFSGSTPLHPDWSKLNIQQSAADFHRIVEAFKTIYSGKWINTGRSKGGMTSIYHRRFYPNDLDATVAHVAPMSYSVSDQRYATFLTDTIGGPENAACRSKLAAAQRKLLENRDSVIPDMKGDFSLLGSKNIAFEHAVIELPWSYWQYKGPGKDCTNVPELTDSLARHVDFLKNANDPDSYNDSSLDSYTSYYYQGASQLGNPGTTLDGMADLLLHAPTFNIYSYMPKGVVAFYDNAMAMRDVQKWLATSSEKILYVYGEWDPWSGGPFEVRPNSDSHLFFVPKTNHSAQFSDLKGEARKVAYDRIRAWMGLESEAQLPVDKDNLSSKSLETREFEAMRKLKNHL